MPVCPSCNYEYIEGVKICPDCGIELAPKEDILLNEDWTEDNWEVVFTSDQEYEAEMLKDNLETAGIKSIILSQKDRNFPSAGDFSLIKLVVQKKDAEDAKAYIEKYDNEDFSDIDNNPTTT